MRPNILSLGLGLHPSRYGGSQTTEQWLAANAAVWLDPSDLSTMKQDRTGASATIDAAVDSPVGSLRNKGTAGGWLTASADAARPILRQSGGLYYLEFDGVDDQITRASTSLVGNTYWAAASEKPVSGGGRGMWYHNTAGVGTNYTYFTMFPINAFLGQTDRAGTKHTLQGTVSNTAGVRVGETKFASPESYHNNGSSIALSKTGSPLTDSTTQTLYINETSSKHNLYGFVIVNGDIVSADQLRARQYLATKSGVTL